MNPPSYLFGFLEERTISMVRSIMLCTARVLIDNARTVLHRTWSLQR